MASEIERKFLVNGDGWRTDSARGASYRQGYLSDDPVRVVRVRVADAKGYLTIKGITKGVHREEFEYEVPLHDAEQMLDLCVRPLIEKTRYRVEHGGRTWEIDVFDGDNAGLVIAEVELPSVDAVVTLPPWVSAEVSHDPRYYNSNLARHPYAEWGDDQRNGP